MNAKIGYQFNYPVNARRKDGTDYKGNVLAVVSGIGSFIQCTPLTEAKDEVTGVTILGLTDVIMITPQYFNY